MDPSWYVDSGASTHVTHDMKSLSQISEYGGHDSLIVGDGSGLKITHTGKVVFPTHIRPITLRDVLYVPAIKKNLLSVAKLITDNEFVNSACVIKDKVTRKLLLQGELRDGLYQLIPFCTQSAYVLNYPVSTHAGSKMSLAAVLQSASMSSFPLSNCSFNSNNCISSIQSVNTVNNVQTQKSVSIDIWHQRLGHPSSRVLSQVVSSCNLPIVMKSKLPFCTACKLGKSHALPFPLSDSQCTKPLELIHSNLWEPSPLLSNNGHRLYVIFVDDFSWFCWFYLLQSKSEVSTIFPIFKVFVENQFSTSIKAIQIDGATEYKPLYYVFHQHGIALRITCPYTSQQNGQAER